MKYQGKEVRSRLAKAGDDGYDATKEQVVITLPDGTNKTVLKTEVQG